MKLVKTLLAVLCLVPALAFAASEKLAVINEEAIIKGSRQVLEVKQQFREQFQAEFERLKKIRDEGRALKERLKKEADFLSEAERKSLIIEVQKKGGAFNQLQQNLALAEQQQLKQLLQQLGPKVDAVLQELSEKYDLDLIMKKQGVAYINTKTVRNLTTEVIEALNKK
ncbi:OmpH family outer membrane protein [Motiliproteus sp. MSK22-1]|uniref:OmpH family outer membrane protein n=1 Tax=Motiliproteus sp. MSK22-1 TaxID=1897630 RepID=UPI00097623EB|nr:OmpH family outer membrane protein [Motiliproteus sp. MSK22-1]OMH39166.1 hypothetical protein BGP75_05580 [Motiliproteus sp. MSK22-1]